MEGKIGQMAHVGDNWHQIKDIRKVTNELSGEISLEYKLYLKEMWVPSSEIKGFENNYELKKRLLM